MASDGVTKVIGTRRIGEMSAEMFEMMAEQLHCEAIEVEQALEVALESLLAPRGGVMLVWWDTQHGLRLNPALYPPAEGG